MLKVFYFYPKLFSSLKPLCIFERDKKMRDDGECYLRHGKWHRIFELLDFHGLPEVGIRRFFYNPIILTRSQHFYIQKEIKTFQSYINFIFHRLAQPVYLTSLYSQKSVIYRDIYRYVCICLDQRSLLLYFIMEHGRRRYSKSENKIIKKV